MLKQNWSEYFYCSINFTLYSFGKQIKIRLVKYTCPCMLQRMHKYTCPVNLLSLSNTGSSCSPLSGLSVSTHTVHGLSLSAVSCTYESKLTRHLHGIEMSKNLTNCRLFHPLCGLTKGYHALSNVLDIWNIWSIQISNPLEFYNIPSLGCK